MSRSSRVFSQVPYASWVSEQTPAGIAVHKLLAEACQGFEQTVDQEQFLADAFPEEFRTYTVARNQNNRYRQGSTPRKDGVYPAKVRGGSYFVKRTSRVRCSIQSTAKLVCFSQKQKG